jgi:hypothetical protein
MAASERHMNPMAAMEQICERLELAGFRRPAILGVWQLDAMKPTFEL